MFELRLINTPEEFFNEYHKYGEGIQKTLKFSADGISITTVMSEIINGMPSVRVWAGILDNDWIGFVVTKVMETPEKRRYLLIYMLFAKEKLSPNIYLDGLRQLDSYAKAWCCTWMEMYTTRDRAFEKVLEPFGWKPKQTIFSREVL